MEKFVWMDKWGTLFPIMLQTGKEKQGHVCNPTLRGLRVKKFEFLDEICIEVEVLFLPHLGK